MAEAANLSVSITGDASGLIDSLNSANAALTNLNISAGTIMNDFDGKEAQIKISAADETAAGVNSARANINSLQDKTVTISVKYNVSGMPNLAAGTRNAHEGLAVVNDERGVGDPRELIEHNGRLMMFSGRDVVVPLSSGDRVYTAAETKSIMTGLGLPHYASGKNNEWFEIEKADLNHYKKTHNMSPAEELEWWNRLMEQFSYDSEVVKEIEEEIFAAQQKVIAEQEKILKSEKQANEEALSDYKRNSDTWIKYQTEVNDMGVQEQIDAYQRQLYNYNAMVSDMIVSTQYSAEEIKEIWDDFYEYKAGVDLKIGKLENEKNYAVYEKWQSDAENWKNIRDTYDDWEEAGDSPVKFYERSIERIQQMYDGGFVGWQEYRDDSMEAQLNLYKAKMDEIDKLLDSQKRYISNLKQQFEDEENALSEKWEVQDRTASKAEISHQLDIYKGAVTQRGMDKYKSLQEEMKKIRREEEMYQMQKSHTQTISDLEENYDIIEDNKKYLLATIEKSGINLENIVSGINRDIESMESTITSLFAQTISAIKSISISSNSYSDNRNISISGNSADIIDALKNRVGLSIAYGSYY
ncbi:MAG: hypothetical protein ACI4A5_06000 [Hominilimicola sp.]